jgi:hypothetical protein
MSQIRTPKIKALSLGLAVAVVCVVSVGIRADKRMEASTPLAKESRATPQAVTVPAPLAPTEADDRGFWLIIRPTGFETREMTLDAGDYFVVIQNATGLDRFALQIQREGGETIHQVRLPRFKKYWKHMVTLTPGRYFVSELDHPEWTCVITVN